MPKRVGIVTSSFPRFDGDPAGPFVAEHAAWLRAAGHSVEVVAAGDPGDELHGDIPVTRVPARGGLFYAGGAPEALARTRRSWPHAATFTAALTAAVARRARRWDAIIAHWLVPSALAACAARKPVVAIAHSGDVHLLARTRLATPLAALLAARRARLVFVSRFVRKRFYDAIPPGLMRRVDARAQVCPMGIDVARFRHAAASPKPLRRQPTVVFLGRLVPVKGADTLIAAAQHLRSDANVIIAGDGPQALALARRARHAGNVKLVGEVRGEARDRLLAHADVVVVPSVTVEGARTEGMPVVALEAMAAGTAVVASRVGGLAELPAASVLHVPPAAPETLARAIDESLSNSSATAARVAAATRFVSAFDWSVVGPKLQPR